MAEALSARHRARLRDARRRGLGRADPDGAVHVFDVGPGACASRCARPADYGLRPCSAADLTGADAAYNARELTAVLCGEDRGAHRDALLLGAALALEVGGARSPTPRAGIERAAAAIDERRRAARAGTASVQDAAARGSGRRERDFSMRWRPRAAPGCARARASPRRRARGRPRARLPAPPALRLAAGGFDLIAELKLRSPAAGALATAGATTSTRAVAAYARAGAAAVSVLTEPSRFDGRCQHLQRAARALAPLGVPVMRKDFLVDPYQVLRGARRRRGRRARDPAHAVACRARGAARVRARARAVRAAGGVR